MPSESKGFTLVELMVSIAVIGLITLAVIGDIARTRQQTELLSTATTVQAELRNMQADALAARSIKTCAYSGNNVPCEYDGAECRVLSQSCSVAISPSDFGMTFVLNATNTTEFADTFTADFAETKPYERFKVLKFINNTAGSNNVIISSIIAGGSSVGSSIVAFQRQNGGMRINGCATPPCASEVTTMTVTLKHLQTNKTRDITFNAVTGRITVQ
jgi:prepilin-type N-terminal cleavage/methylation domain-containing protein